MIMAAFGKSSEAELEALFSQVAWYQKPSFSEFLAGVTEAKKAGFAVDRGAMFQGITLVSVPVLSPLWEPLLILTGAGRSRGSKSDASAPGHAARVCSRRRFAISVRSRAGFSGLWRMGNPLASASLNLSGAVSPVTNRAGISTLNSLRSISTTWMPFSVPRNR